ncbi:MAG: papain-like cysteine protease family protein [Byssovorax sp.]
MTKGARALRYNGGEKHSFPHHRQEHEKSCGPACLRMLAEWLTEQPQSEYAWRKDSGWSADSGLQSERMPDALSKLPNCTHRPFKRYKRLTSIPPSTVYLLFTDSYWYDGENYNHWIVLLHLFNSKDGQVLALCADPMENALSVRRWIGLLESRVISAFEIQKLNNDPRSKAASPA